MTSSQPSRDAGPCGKLSPVSLLTELDAFYTEHRRGSQARPAGADAVRLDSAIPVQGCTLTQDSWPCAYMVRDIMVLAFRVVALTAGTMLMVACASGRPQTTSDVPSGREIFFSQCYGCHTLGGAGTPIAPDLSRVGARLSREEIERRLRDPRTHKPDARMPKLDLSEAEVQALATYLSELR
jgi:mono/diheme cytochrome c family protein